MMRLSLSRALCLGASLLAASPVQAQWSEQASHVTADLSGISAVDEHVAWASGAAGTVLHTEDGGQTWRRCAVPPGAAGLDLRGVQVFDKDTAVVMAGGRGDGSALFKTSDGCATWKKVLANPDAQGSFQALRRATAYDIYLLGEPVNGAFVVYLSHNAGDTWTRETDGGLAVPKGVRLTVGGGAAMANVLSFIAFGGAGEGAPVYTYGPLCKGANCVLGWSSKATPLAQGGAIASVAGRNVMIPAIGTVTGIGTMPATALVAVGGDLRHAEAPGFAAFSTDGGNSWKPASVPPSGYRTAVDFDGDHNRFIAVGPQGTDVSVDDGLIWEPMRSSIGQARGWTALSIPFAVGASGRIGKLSDR